MRPQLTGVLETSLYVADPEHSAQFYKTVFGFEPIAGDSRACALSVAGKHVLLLFKKGASRNLPLTSHDGEGQLHVAFAIAAADLAAWEKWLGENGIAIVDRRSWERGGQSLYFRDPDQHLLEVATPGVWTIY